MKITLVKGVKIPEKRAKKTFWPFLQMEIGDSFLVPPDKIKSCRSAASFWSMKLGRRFTVRSLPNEKGVRCWRIKP